MSILGKYTDNMLDEDNNAEVKGYTVPVMVRKNNKDTLNRDITISAILHPTAVGVIYLLSLVLLFFGIKFTLFDRPKPKMKDIEFVLVEKEGTPINKKTPYRADKDSRAGGKHDPSKKVSMPSPAPAQAQKPSPAPQPQAKAPKPSPQPKQQQPAKKVEPKKQVAQQPAPPKPVEAPKPQQQPPAPKAKEIAKPNPPTAKPSIKPPLTPKPVATPSSAFQVPVPPSGTKAGTYATGPISGSGSAPTGGSTGGPVTGSSSGKYTPAPSLAPTGGGNPSGQKLAKGGGGGSGTPGNPGPGNPNGAPGIDAIKEPDFGPYMRELQRRIKMNWDPPKGNESKRVVLLFKIAKDGRLLSCSVYKSSGLPNADKAALDAVKLTAPFRPLPADYKGQTIDIQFTFDYNVFGAAGYQ